MSNKLSPAEITLIKDQHKISDVIGKYVQWDQKKSQMAKGDYWACCVFHGEKTPSFHCVDSKNMYFCFACGASGDNLKFLQEHVGMSFVEAIKELGGDLGTHAPPERAKELEVKHEADKRARVEEQEQSDEQRTRIARAIFKRGVPIEGTLAETYLLNRDIPQQEWDSNKLRFCENINLDQPPFGKCPALVCAATDINDEITAIWRIYLTPEGTALKDDSGHSIKMGKGPSSGSSVRLGPVSSIIAITEGLETAFGVKAITQNKISVWAGLSTSGMVGLDIPDTVREIRIYSDADLGRFHQEKFNLITPPGRQAANKLAERAKKMGVSITISEPPMGSDWLDVWQSIRGMNA